jgi:hypothetical protein
MAVTHGAVNARTYLGDSGEAKPDAGVGSRFIETDTGKEFVFDGGAWALAPITAQLESILATGDVTTIDITAIGSATDDTIVIDPEAVSATVVGLLRGVLRTVLAIQVAAEATQAAAEAMQAILEDVHGAGVLNVSTGA